jgi:hypothetical protein
MRHPALALSALLLTSAAAAPTSMPTSMPATMPTTGPSAIDWSEAAKHVGETVAVTGPVKGTHVAGERVVLNIGKDFPDKDRFTIFVPFDAAAGSADDQFVGKTATVTGKVKMYKGVPEIVAEKATDVTVRK